MDGIVVNGDPLNTSPITLMVDNVDQLPGIAANEHPLNVPTISSTEPRPLHELGMDERPEHIANVSRNIV